MELDLLGGLNQPQAPPKRTGWQHYRAACKLVGLCASSSLIVQIARLIPPLAPVVAIAMAMGCMAVLAWALTTKGDQRFEIALVMIACVGGIALGLRDAAEVLTLIGAKYWIGAASILAIAGVVFISEGRSRGK